MMTDTFTLEKQIKTLVFDWGNTLMVDFPQYHGPMASWPEVSAIEGAKHILEKLKPAYQIVVATNASASTTGQVGEALERVHLRRFVDQIFTSRDLGGFNKPDLQFFRGIEKTLQCDPKQLLMIGDNIIGDILGAQRAGWFSQWFNPSQLPAPGHTPLHNSEIYNLSDIILSLQDLQLPDFSQSMSWLLEQGATNTLLIHVQLVAAVAYQLALWLRATGIHVNPILTHRGGLLHDIAKLSAKRNPLEKRNHGEAAAQLLFARGQPEIAEIARRHLLFCILEKENAPQTWEQKLVYFADKLIEGGQLASLEDRLAALKLRYAHDSATIQACAPALYSLQDEISSLLNFSPNELYLHLSAALYNK